MSYAEASSESEDHLVDLISESEHSPQKVSRKACPLQPSTTTNNTEQQKRKASATVSVRRGKQPKELPRSVLDTADSDSPPSPAPAPSRNRKNGTAQRSQAGQKNRVSKGAVSKAKKQESKGDHESEESGAEEGEEEGGEGAVAAAVRSSSRRRGSGVSYVDPSTGSSGEEEEEEGESDESC